VAAVELEDVRFAVLPQAPQVVPCQQLVEASVLEYHLGGRDISTAVLALSTRGL